MLLSSDRIVIKSFGSDALMMRMAREGKLRSELKIVCKTLSTKCHARAPYLTG